MLNTDYLRKAGNTVHLIAPGDIALTIQELLVNSANEIDSLRDVARQIANSDPHVRRRVKVALCRFCDTPKAKGHADNCPWALSMVAMNRAPEAPDPK